MTKTTKEDIAKEVLTKKPAFRRAVIIISMILFSIVLIFAIGFYTGEISKIASDIFGKNKTESKRHAND